MSIKFNELKKLGVGLAYKHHYLGKLSKNLQHIDCFEVKPEHYFNKTKKLTQELHTLVQQRPLIAHGLYTSIGTAEGLAASHMNNLNRFFRHAPKVEWMGDHIGCTRVSGIHIPHFINIPYSAEMLEILEKNVRSLRKNISIPFIFENIPAEFMYPESEMSEPEFIHRFVEKTGSGLLFDITNMYANCLNFGWDINEYLKQYPVNNIVQVHFNGGKLDKKGRYLDTHSEPTPEIIWDVMKEIVQKAPSLKAIILERDDEADLDELVTELSKAKQIMKKYGKWH